MMSLLRIKGGNNITYILCIVDITGPSRSFLASLAILSDFKITVLTILSEYPLDSRLLLWILLYPLHLIIAFSLIFHYFAIFLSFFIITITLSLITLFHLLLSHVFSLVFIDFTLFKFSFCSSTSSTLFL